METTQRTIYQTAVTEGNFTIVQDKDMGSILFGCPPEVVKYFNRENEPIPSNIVIPQRTFRKGKNYFDLEFIVYTIIFFQQSSSPMNIVCTKAQENRIRTILNESLFGPDLKNILKALLTKSLSKFHLNKKQINFLTTFIARIGSSQEIISLFKGIVANEQTSRKVCLRMQPVLRKYLEKRPRFRGLIDGHFVRNVTKAFVNAAMLKREMRVFARCEENECEDFLKKYVKFNHFDLNGKVSLIGNNGARFSIHKIKNGSFKIYKNRKLLTNTIFGQINNDKDTDQIAKAPIEIPELGITFVGTGTGFDPATFTSCFIIWIDGKGIAVDLVANCETHFRQLGISSNDINHIFLSHLHADHDAGILEKIMGGKKSHLLTSPIIFDSFLRKAAALTRFSKENLRDFVYFKGLDENKEVRVPGIERAYITFDYAFHSIPTGRFKLRYKSLDGKEVTIGYSGDTKYDKKLINELCQDGVITVERRDEILGFLWDCDIIIHEAGGGILHTEVEALSELPQRLKQKAILIHTDKKTRKMKGFHFAKEGETINIIKRKDYHFDKNLYPLIKNTGLFPRLTARGVENILQDANSSIKTFEKGDTIVRQSDRGYSFYIILSGFAEAIKNNSIVAIYDKGCFFGELAVTRKDKRRRASIVAKSKLVLLCIERTVFNKFNLSSILQEKMYNFVNYYTDWPLPSLIGYLSRGKLLEFQKGDDIVKFGDTSRDIYFLISGKVDILNSTDKIIAHITDVDIFGEIAHLKKVPRTATVKVSTKRASAICINEKLFREISEKFPSFYATVLKKMDKRLEALEHTQKIQKGRQ